MSYEQSEKAMAAGRVLGARSMTLLEKLTGRKQEMEAMLADVNAAIAALESSPEITKSLEAINKVNRFM